MNLICQGWCEMNKDKSNPISRDQKLFCRAFPNDLGSKTNVLLTKTLQAHTHTHTYTHIHTGVY